MREGNKDTKYKILIKLIKVKEIKIRGCNKKGWNTNSSVRKMKTHCSI